MREARVSVAVWSGVVLALVAPATAGAQELFLTGPLAGAPAARGSHSSKRDARVVMPTGHLEVAGEVAFLMSQRSPWVPELELTDLALFRLNVRRSFADWLELYAGGDLLPKQPTSTSAESFQGAHVGAQAEFAKGFASGLALGVGPLLGAEGVYYRGGPGLSWKPSVSEYLRFVVGAGASWTILDYRPSTQATFWLGEVVSHAETQIGDNNASMWVGLDYAVPYAARPRAVAADPRRGYLDPQVRLSLELGGSMSLRADGWDVYASYTIIDRGELNKPETTLPILDGGFDQQQLAIGVEYRFDPQRRRIDPAY